MIGTVGGTRPAEARLAPTGMTVLYDAGCPVCRQARRWVEAHRQLVPVRFVPAGSDAARGRFPQLDMGSTLHDVTVVTDEGAVLRGERAWIAVLWAVARTRPFAVELAHGVGTWRLRRLRSATEIVRHLAAHSPAANARPANWPPPGAPPDTAGCNSCGH